MKNLAIFIMAVIATLTAVVIFMNLAPARKTVEHTVDPQYSVGDEQFIRVFSSLLGPPFLRGHKIESYKNGDEIFPAMLEEINAATETICFETYIYWSGNIGKKFVDALSKKAREGVKVHVLLDWVGSEKIDQAFYEILEKAGVEVEKYRPLTFYNLTRMNYRTHRKLLIVDGKVGFTGGVGIADQWLGSAKNESEWRDSHFKLTGPVVAQMQAAFMENWLETHQNVLDSSAYFPKLETAGNAVAQMFKSSPEGGSENVRLMYLTMVASAKSQIAISSSYFVPDELSVEVLVKAAKRGVNIEIIVPGEFMDAKIVQKASRASWGPLLKAGIKIYRYKPTMFHAKIMIVDGLLVSVGSTNFDPRSFKLNDEANLNVLDRRFAKKLLEDFADDKKNSQQVTYEQWEKRGIKEKTLEYLSNIVRSQL